MKIFIEPGQEFELSVYMPVRVGESGTCKDMECDFHTASKNGKTEDGEIDDGMGSISVDGESYVVYFDQYANRFWYNNEWKNCI